MEWTVILIFFVVCAYPIPFLIAEYRNHPKTGEITIVNIALGWTFFGWLAALKYSLTDDVYLKSKDDENSCDVTSLNMLINAKRENLITLEEFLILKNEANKNTMIRNE